MSMLSDPSICPDCRAPLGPDLVCTRCGLVLRGPAAVALWEHLQQADLLIGHLRSQTAGAPVAPASTPRSAPSLTADLPPAPPIAARPAPARRPSGLSVPVVLLGLGGVCVLVAAIVFVAVTWSSLGLAGRTAIMIAVTAVAAAGAAVLTRRGLRGGAETLWLVTHVLITIDVIAATVADLAGLGSVDAHHLVAGLGALLLVCSLAVSAWATTTTVHRLHGLVVVTAVGTLLATAAEAWAADRSALATALSLPAIAAATWLAARIVNGRLRPQAYAIATAGALSWLVLLGHGLSRSESTTASVWWHDAVGWPLLAAAAAAAVASWPRAVPTPIRSLAAGAALVCLTLLAMGGTSEAQTKVLVACGVAAALAVLTARGPRVWAWPAALMVALAALLATPAAALRPFGVIADLPTTAPARGHGLDLAFSASTWALAPWTAPIIAAVAALCLLAPLRFLPDAARAAGRSACLALTPVLIGLGLTTWYLETEPRLLPAVAAWSALLIAAAAVTVGRREDDGTLTILLVADAYLIGVGLRLAVPSHLLIALLATVSAAALAFAALRTRPERLGRALVPALSGGAAFLVFLAATHWPYLVGGSGNAAGLTLALVATAVGLAAAWVGRTTAARITLETAALLAGLVATTFTTSSGADAAILTIVGSAVALASILHTDREPFSWVGSGVLAIAVVIRVDGSATAPELVALPAAALLVAAGVRRLLTDPAAKSYRVLGSGLTLGLVPSLLGALDDPVSVRGALVAVAGLGFLALGVSRRWAAPFVAGAAVVALVSLRHLGPIAAALPRWISLGSVGVALLLVGITWEARRRDASKAERYLTALR